MRNHCLVLLSLLGLLGCADKHPNNGDGGGGGGQAGHGGGQAGHGGGQAGAAGTAAGGAGSAAGAAGSIIPSGSGGTGGASGSGGTSGSGGAAGQAGDGGRGGTTASGAGGTAAGGGGGASGAGGTTAVGGTGGFAGATGTSGFAGAAGGGGRGGTTGAGGTSGSGGATGTGGAAGQAGASGSPGLRLLAGGLGAFGYVDGTGAAARFNAPTGIASDGAGNLFVADRYNNAIRKVVIATGAVTTLAGAVPQGSADGTGAAARFAGPYGVAVDGAGNLFVIDGYNRTIRKVVIATGAVTTLAGSPGVGGGDDGTGASAHFIGPSGIVADGAGNLYVSDASRSDISSRTLIRKVVISTGAVTTLANLPGESYDPGGYYDANSIAIDGASNLYVAYNSAVLKVVPATGAVTTLAGVVGQRGPADGTGASARFFHPSGIAGDGAGNLYVADTGNSAVRKIVIATGAVTTLSDATGVAVGFNGPIGIASGGNGDLYLTENDNTIRRVVIATGTVTTLAGAVIQPGSADATGASARFNGPDGVASDGAGNIYVADSVNSTIRKIVIATGVVTTLAGAAGQEGTDDGTGASARFYRPFGIASDGAGNLYVADGIIRKVVIATGAVTTLTTGPGRDPYDPGPSGIVSDGAGNLYFASAGSAIWKVATATGALTAVAGVPDMHGSTDGIGAGARFDGPDGIASDGAGNLYVADSGNNTIRKIVMSTRAVTTLAGTAGEFGTADGTGAAARFSSLRGIASDGAGNLYVADGHTIRKVAINSATVTTVIGSPDRIGVSLGALPASLGVPHGVAVLPSGELAIVDNQENAVLIGHL